MADTVYPTNIRVYIDGVDQTNWLFNVDDLDVSDFNNRFKDIDITPLLPDPGEHKIEITCDDGVGRVEVRLEIE